jgi:hypothetical protein
MEMIGAVEVAAQGLRAGSTGTSTSRGGAPSMPRPDTCGRRATTTSGWTISLSFRMTSMGETNAIASLPNAVRLSSTARNSR